MSVPVLNGRELLKRRRRKRKGLYSRVPGYEIQFLFRALHGAGGGNFNNLNCLTALISALVGTKDFDAVRICLISANFLLTLIE